MAVIYSSMKVGYLLALSAEVVHDCTHGGNACQGQIPRQNARHIVPHEGGSYLPR